VITCAASPCGRLSRSPWRVVTSATTTGTPSPWGSRPVGDPVVRLRCTCRARRRPPTHLLDHPRWAAFRATEVVPTHGFTPGHGTAPVTDVIPAGAHFHHWRLGFKQSSLGHIVRALRHPGLDASSRSPLSRHALVPDGFPLQVSRATHEPPSESIPAARGIQRSASRRTPAVRLSPQRALHVSCQAVRRWCGCRFRSPAGRRHHVGYVVDTCLLRATHRWEATCHPPPEDSLGLHPPNRPVDQVHRTAPVFTGASSDLAVPSLADTLPPFPMYAALPRSEYYGGSAPSAPSAGIAPIHHLSPLAEAPCPTASTAPTGSTSAPHDPEPQADLSSRLQSAARHPVRPRPALRGAGRRLGPPRQRGLDGRDH
jgi:hypothetical protein